MKQTKFVSYLRVSTAKQGRSGLGLAAQRAAIDAYAAPRNLTELKTFTEIESGKTNARPELARAVDFRRTLSRDFHAKLSHP